MSNNPRLTVTVRTVAPSVSNTDAHGPGADPRDNVRMTNRLVFIFGEVRLPGAYPAPPGTDLLQLIAIAGGTTPEARLGEVSVVMDGANGQVVAKVDLKEIISSGSAAPFLVAAGDRVIIPGSEADLAGQIIDGIGTAFAFSLDIMSAWLLYITLDDRLDDRAAEEAAAR